jgi:HlyD family secretion protein
MKLPTNKLVPALVVLAVVAGGWYAWDRLRDNGPGEGFARGNGRIEATEVDVATKLAGRVSDILVFEGDFVTAGQPLARMQITTLEAQHDEAVAQHQQAINAAAAAGAGCGAQERQGHVGSVGRPARGRARRGAPSARPLRNLVQGRRLVDPGMDDDRARERSAQAAVTAARAQVAAAQSAIEAAQAQVVGAQSTVAATQATIARIRADIDDSELKAPRDGRIQYRVAQPAKCSAPAARC